MRPQVYNGRPARAAQVLGMGLHIRSQWRFYHFESGILPRNSFPPRSRVIRFTRLPIPPTDPSNWLFRKERCSNKLRSRTAKDGALSQNTVCICPIKLLLLALSTARLFIGSHVVDGKCPVNKLLEMFSTLRGWTGDEDGSSLRCPLSWLKLTSRMMMLLDDTNSIGNTPDNKLFLEAKKISVTVLSVLQLIPSHVQQSVPFRHDLVRSPSCESPARNVRRELLSCSVQELVGDAQKRISTRARPREVVGNLLLFFMCEKWSAHMLSLKKSAWRHRHKF
ncbi:hypothetical protein EJB05_25243 [Eragrostis curvula]|uniref:Uncharacterized protein n=1 Tax=Eragrostis curvula TaxID=38414 RepID=A0A5J9VBT9_9POAL|nr:hypothetical protein EJB05_25243 [Eragrostis curvula]